MPRAEVAPLLLGPKNTEQATGLPWRFVRDHAKALGIEPIRIGRKLAVPARKFLRALTRAPAAPVAPGNDPVDAAAAVRLALGKRRRL